MSYQLTVPFFNAQKHEHYYDWNKFLAYYYQKSKSRIVKDSIIELNLGLIKKLARSFYSYKQPLEDLIQVGVLCLYVSVIDRYDPKQYAFSTFAIPHITGAMKRHLQKTGNTIYLPAQVQRNYLAIKRAKQEHLQETGEENISLENLSERSNLDKKKIRLTLRAYAQQPTSIDRQVLPTVSRSFSECIADPKSTADDYNEDMHKLNVVNNVLSNMEEDMRSAIMLHYVEGMTQKQISEHLNIKISAVRTSLSRGLSILRRVCPALLRTDTLMFPKNHKESRLIKQYSLPSVG